MTQAFPPAGVHLWSAFVSVLEDPDHYAASFALLSSEEQAHANRFRFDSDRESFVASRALRRRALSHYADVESRQWQFTVNEYGRPGILFPLMDELLEFNCSKSPDLVVCAVTRGIPVGVDIESLDRKVTPGFAESTCAPSEWADIKSLPGDEQGKRFLAYWTLKESYLKARGVGLSVRPDSMDFSVTASPRLTGHLEFSPANDGSEWQFALLSPTPFHIAAICVRRQGDLDLLVEMRPYSSPSNSLKQRNSSR
jgi:4'-phosphopantetheinyl transferase